MNAAAAPTATTGTLDVPGAHLHHEVRGAGPLVVLFGTPMSADAFTPLADLLAADHTVLTSDPRGIGRSPVDDRDATPSIATRADDLARLIAHVSRDGATGPVTLFGSSGGAVTSLGVAQYHPDAVDVVIAHEPPLTELLDDHAEMRASREETIRLWFAGDHLGSWRNFFASSGLEIPEEIFQAMFAHPNPQSIADNDYQNGHLVRPTTEFRPDVDALRRGCPQVVVGLGDQSAGQTCDRTSRARAEQLGTTPTMFPGGHVGFADDAAAFLPALRAVLPA